jgi:hypothetical protein
MLELAADGASAVELRCEVGRISVDLWDRWIREDPQYSETVKECKALCEMWWEKQGRKMAAGTADGNATVWIFNMKNRFGWKDKTETEHSGTIAFSDMTDEQIERRIAALKTGKD